MNGPAAASSSMATTAGSTPGPSTLPPTFIPPRPKPPKQPPKPILKRPPPPPQPFFAFTRNILSISSKFLPPNAQSPTNTQNGEQPQTPASTRPPSPLKRAHFIVSHLSTTYPISSQAPPSTPELYDNIRDIEERETERRIRDNNDGNWSLERVEEFYKDCCRLRDEAVLGGVVRGIRLASHVAPRTLDLTGTKLTAFSAAALADILSVEWGLRKLILKDCDLDEQSLKPILHALLITQSLPYLSLAGNKRFKPTAFKLIGAFAQKAKPLQFIDLSHTPLDRRSVEYLIVALETAPQTQPRPSREPSPQPSPLSPSSPLPSGNITSYFGQPHTNGGLPSSGFSTPAALLSPTANGDAHPKDPAAIPLPPTPSELLTGLVSPTSPSSRVYRSHSLAGSRLPKAQLVSLRLDECGIRGGSLEALAQAARTSCLVNVSLRANRIGPAGAVGIALLMKDYPDTMPFSPTTTPSGLAPPGSPASTTSSLLTVDPSVPPSPSSPDPNISRSSPFQEASLHKPPPQHPLLAQKPTPAAAAPIQPTYTPYIPRSRRNMVPVVAHQPGPPGSQVPVITSNKAGGVTTRHLPPPSPLSQSKPLSGTSGFPAKPGSALDVQKSGVPGRVEGHSAALLDKVRSLNALPKLGALQTLDIRGNDLRNGVTYIAQVLKRNRTLKVLNLSENRIDAQGLMAIAEALKYNSTLETLDMSKNPCCGPGLEGITSIRTAFTINRTLKRLFLSSTNLTSPGAIALAEFIPEARSLLHLDLTSNTLDIAGVMALSVGLKMNESIRCLDVNVPPNDPEFARLSREILKCCIRNTERAANEVGRFENGGSSLSTASSDAFGLGLGLAVGPGTGFGSRGGVWGLIEKSELAKVVKEEAERQRIGEEAKQLDTLGGKERYDIWKKTPPEIIRAAKECSEDLQLLLGGILPAENGRKERLVERAQALASVIGEMVPVEKDADTMQELLGLNDELLGFVKRVKTATESSLSLDMSGAFDSEEVASPRVDKGKGRATPQEEDLPEPRFTWKAPAEEPEVPSVTSPRTKEHESPVDRSRKWVEEEGEVFRKGTVLLGPEEMGEVEGVDAAQASGDELRLELLEAQVERPRHRLIDPDLDTAEDVPTVRQEGSDERRSPLSPR